VRQLQLLWQAINICTVAPRARHAARPHTATRRRVTAYARTSDQTWGWLPGLSVVGALGVLLLAIAHSGARYDAIWAQPLYWTGLVILIAPLGTRLMLPGVSRREAIGLIIVMGMGAYFAKLLHSPIRFTFFDEFLHWRTAHDMLISGRLFTENSLLPVSPLYPGLEIAATAIANVTGLSIFTSGVIVVGVARLVLVLALYLFFEQIAGSVRVAGIATALYMGNPHFVIFDAQFAYESLALAFLLMILLALLRRQRVTGSTHLSFNLVAVLGLGALVATHHATSYMTTIFLALWGLVTIGYNWWLRAKEPGPIWITLLAAAMNAAWLLGVSSITIGYLAPHLMGAVESILNLIAGEGSDRELFKSSSGIPTPLLEKLIGLGGPGLITLCMPFGLLQFWLKYRRSVIAWTLAIGALSYPVTLVMRLTGGGWEVSARSSVFVFIPLVFVLALALEYTWLPRRINWVRPVLFAPYIAVFFCSGIIGGWSPWARMPWPYMVGADTRSIEPQGLAAAEWAGEYLGPNNRVAADRINTTLWGTYGEQRMITHLIDEVSISGIFLAPHIGPHVAEAIREGRIHYIVVDMRVSQALPFDGHYYESWEKMVVPYSHPISPAVLGKFDHIAEVNRLFDSGDIRVYDIGALADEP